MVISWTTYIAALLIMLGIYYAVVILLYFRKGGSKTSNKKGQVNKAVDSVLFSETEPDNLRPDASGMAPVHSLVDELQALVTQAGKEKMDKVSLFKTIRKLLKKYPKTKGSIYQEGINNLISVITENNCGIHFSADDLRDMWLE